MTVLVALASGSLCAAADTSAVRPLMERVLAGELAPRLAARSVAGLDIDPEMAQQLATELGDMGRGGYATTGNRSFESLAPAWAEARAAHVSRAPVPDGHLPEAVLALPATVKQVLAVDLELHVAWLLLRGPDGWRVADRYYTTSGRGGPAKRRRGDLRTPVGVYFVTERLDTRRLSARYGDRALELDYPNALDRAAGRTGDGIWLHGIDPANNIRPPLDTDGCVAFVNERIRSLDEQITVARTPVVVGTRLLWHRAPRQSVLMRELQRAVDRWALARSGPDAEALFSMYEEGFSPDRRAASDWQAGRREVLAAGVIARVEISDVEIYRADAARGVYLTRFRQRLVREGWPDVTTRRRLYWRHVAGGWRIVAEQGG